MFSAASTIIAFVGLFLALAATPVLVARRRREAGTIRRFLRAALVCGVVSGTVVASSDQLVERCRDQGNTNFQDYGATGLLFLVVAGFVAVAAARTWTLITD